MGTEGAHFEPAEVAAHLGAWIDGLDAVHSASRRAGGEYAVVFRLNARPEAGVRFLLDDDGAFQMDATGRSLGALSATDLDFLLPPPRPPKPPPDLRGTGVPAVDTVLAEVVVRDLVGLAHRTRAEVVACAAPSDGAVQCPEGRGPGTPVEAFRALMCGPAFWLPVEDTLAYVLDNVVGMAPEIVAIARADGANGIAYWVIIDSHAGVATDRQGHALGLAAGGEVALLHQGCGESPEALVATFTDFLLPPSR